MEDGYIRVVGRVSPAAGKSWEQFDVDRVMSMGETALVASQRRLYRKIDNLSRGKQQHTVTNEQRLERIRALMGERR